MSRQGQTKHVWRRIGTVVAAAAIIVATSTVGSVIPVHAGSDTYPWSDAACVTPNPSTNDCTGSVTYDNWGYTTCPANDGNCTRLSGTRVINGVIYTYGESDPWGEYLRNCTSYVAWMLHSVNGFEMPFFDDAVNWGARAQGLHYTVDMNPKQGSIFWDSGHDHVGWVESVSTDGSTVTYEDYNSGYNGVWGEHTVATTSASGYIHFKDVSSSGGGASPTSTSWSGNMAASWGSGRLDIFVKTSATSGNNVNHKWYGGFWAWDNLPALTQQVASWPSAVSWGSGRIDVFAQSSSKTLIHAYYDGSWHDWEDFGGCITGAPAVSSWGYLRLDVFTRGCNDNVHLFHNWYDGAWHGEAIALDGSIASAPSAVSWGVGRIDIFATDSNGLLVQTYYDGTGWHGWVTIGPPGSCISGAPSVSTWGSGRLDVFGRDCPDGNNLVHMWYDGAWHGWEDLNPAQQITTSPSAVSWGEGRIDVFGRSATGTLLHRYFDATGWHAWEDLGGTLGS